MEENHKKLYLSSSDKIIAGVCGGLGEYFGVDPLIFRALFLLFTFGGGAGILVYIILAIITPKHPEVATDQSTKERANEFAQQVKDSAHNFVAEMKSAPRQRGRRTLAGLVIVIFGVALLLNALFPQHWFKWEIFWPVMIILAGVAILSKKQ